MATNFVSGSMTAAIFASPWESHFTSCKTNKSINLPSGLLWYLKYLRGICAQRPKWCKCRKQQPFEKVHSSTEKGKFFGLWAARSGHSGCRHSHKWVIFTLIFKYTLYWICKILQDSVDLYKPDGCSKNVPPATCTIPVAGQPQTFVSEETHQLMRKEDPLLQPCNR